MIGILGSGQLARMLALAGKPMGQQFRVYDPAKEAPASAAADIVRAPFDDLSSLEAFIQGLDVVTYEFENVPVETAQFLAERVAVYPPPQALAVAQDRWTEKTTFRELGIKTPDFAAVDSLDDLQHAVASLGAPAVLKTRRFGYDGKGQVVLRDRSAVEQAWQELNQEGLILESFVPFTRELSVLAVRAQDGEMQFYPLVENEHRGGILRVSKAPAKVDEAMTETARKWARRLAERLDYVGLLAMELFDVDGQLLANECAPRVHNSGHWTIEGAETSQFENHLRAVLGQPLGATGIVAPSTMINLIGQTPPLHDVLAIPGAHPHYYEKSPRAGRKVGHITVRQTDGADFDQCVAEIIRLAEAS